MAEPLARRPEVRELVASSPARYSDVPADPDFSVRMLDDVSMSELDLVMLATARGLHRKAVTLAYDGARKAVDGVMLAMGLRVGRGEGAHAAVVDFAETEFVETPAEQRDARGFATARIARNAEEYPQPRDLERSETELQALAQACARLVGHCRGRLGLDPRHELVPTDTKVEAYLRDGPTEATPDRADG